jgi:hypothetical protein
MIADLCSDWSNALASLREMSYRLFEADLRGRDGAEGTDDEDV